MFSSPRKKKKKKNRCLTFFSQSVDVSSSAHLTAHSNSIRGRCTQQSSHKSMLPATKHFHNKLSKSPGSENDVPEILTFATTGAPYNNRCMACR